MFMYILDGVWVTANSRDIYRANLDSNCQYSPYTSVHVLPPMTNFAQGFGRLIERMDWKELVIVVDEAVSEYAGYTGITFCLLTGTPFTNMD